MLNGRMSSADDPFSDMSAASPDTRDPNSLFNNDDAFASFSANDTVRITLVNFATVSFLFSFCVNFCSSTCLCSPFYFVFSFRLALVLDPRPVSGATFSPNHPLKMTHLLPLGPPVPLVLVL
jgi:hypothetical protein